MLNIYNTESRKKEPISLATGQDKIRMYTCGPTIYHFAHIGNFRTYVVEDLFRRAILYFGMPIVQVMNLTDVDDKTIKGALNAGVSLGEYTEKYKKAFFEDLEALNTQPVEIIAPATSYIDAMIAMIEKLLKKGVAYKGKDGDIFFSIKKFPSYGRLSHLKLDELKEGASERVTDEYEKEAASDFVLWKAYKPDRDGDTFWESPFGKGRPGWHIECSAMANALLGDSIDIHMGGVDNIFPHHENEIAQCEACNHSTFVRHWIHVEHLLVDGKKMSKSLGNFYTLRDLFAKGYASREVRYQLMTTHYRTQLNFTLDGLDSARHTLRRIDDFIYRLKKVKQEGGASISPYIADVRKAFKQALADDLNISVAISVLFDMIREINSRLDQKALGLLASEEVIVFLKEVDQVLGVLFTQEEESIPPEIMEAFEKRQKARAAKDWGAADHARDFIQSKGYVIEDSLDGSRVKKQS